MKRISFKISGISLTLPLKLFKELKIIFKSMIESMGYDELEKKFPLFFTFFLKSYEKKLKQKKAVV
jgi:hypothetical protein